MAAYQFGRPETITEQSFARQADIAAPLATLPYAEALGRIQGIPMTGPGDSIYLRQAEASGRLRGDLSAGLAGNLANLKTRQSLQTLAAHEAQASARRKSMEASLARGVETAGGVGAALGSIPGNIIRNLSSIDYLLRRETGEGISDLFKQQAADRAAARGPEPREPVRLSAAYQDPSQASPEELAELRALVVQVGDYEREQLDGVTMEQIRALLSSTNEQERMAGMAMLKKAEEMVPGISNAVDAEASFPVEATRRRRERPKPVESVLPSTLLEAGDWEAHTSYVEQQRAVLNTKAQEALEDGNMELYDGYMKAIEALEDEEAELRKRLLGEEQSSYTAQPRGDFERGLAQQPWRVS